MCIFQYMLILFFLTLLHTCLLPKFSLINCLLPSECLLNSNSDKSFTRFSYELTNKITMYISLLGMVYSEKISARLK